MHNNKNCSYCNFISLLCLEENKTKNILHSIIIFFVYLKSEDIVRIYFNKL